MTAIAILRRCRAAETDIQRVQQRIQQRRDALTYMSPQIKAAGGGHSAAPDKIASITAEIDALARQIADRERAYCAELEAAARLLDVLPGVESSVLHRYYIRRLSIGAIASSDDRSESHIRRVKRDAEKRMDKVAQEEVNGLLPAWYWQTTAGEKMERRREL